ncbi:hypothetical protein V8F20_012801 [Naviculisporaceae sp. PSN 640]
MIWEGKRLGNYRSGAWNPMIFLLSSIGFLFKLFLTAVIFTKHYYSNHTCWIGGGMANHTLLSPLKFITSIDILATSSQSIYSIFILCLLPCTTPPWWPICLVYHSSPEPLLRQSG